MLYCAGKLQILHFICSKKCAKSVADAILTYFLHLFCCIFLHVRMPDCLKKRVPDFFLRRPFTIFAKRY